MYKMLTILLYSTFIVILNCINISKTAAVLTDVSSNNVSNLEYDNNENISNFLQARTTVDDQNKRKNTSDVNTRNDQLPKLTYDKPLKLTSKKSEKTLLPPKLQHEEPINPWSTYNSDQLQQHRELSEDPLLEIKIDYCRRPAKCQPLNYSTCMGKKLPYTSTTLDLTDLVSQDQVQLRLALYLTLRNVPKCWAVIQPFLCSLYMPKCEEGMVDLPSLEMCNITRGPCKVLYGTPFFPPLLRCENDERMPLPSPCKNDLREIKFNTTGQCMKPLIHTDNPSSFYDGVAGCGLQCNNPLYTDDEQNQIHGLVMWGAGACALFNAFTVATFIIDWKTANRYPTLVIFYINFCFLVTCIGWLAQFYGGNSREEIVCRKDGTVRQSEPSAGENLTCVIVFVMVYYFLVAAFVWFVILTYAWHMSFRALGKIQERIDKKGAYFHLAAWSLPLVLTITTMALGEIDGDSASGICFVGYVNVTARALLLIVPLGLALVIGMYFLFRGLLTLIRLKLNSREVISVRANKKIRSTIVRMSLFSLITLVLGSVTIICHLYYFRHTDKWKNSLHKYILCRLTRSDSTGEYCRLESKPSIQMLQLQLFALFSAGIVMSSWIWTHSTIEAWVRFIRKKFDCEKEEPIRLQKHKVIAQAFAKRKMFYNAGRLSISFHNEHTDPVGLNFDLNSVASHDLSSTWAAALPKLVNRRCALTGAPTGSVSSYRRNSLDSEVSFSVRRVSVESRRNSLDSQLSVQVAELKATHKVVSSKARQSRSRRRHRRTSRSAGPVYQKRESSTSLESQMGSTQPLSALMALGPQVVPNLKRRSANAGLDMQQINELLMSGNSALPGFSVSYDDPVSDNKSSQTSECPELSRLVVQSSLNSGVSVGTQHNGCTSVDVAVQADARDIAIQTLSSYELEMAELRNSINELNNSRSKSRVSQGTQMSPVENRKLDLENSEKSPAPKKPKRTSLNKQSSPVQKYSNMYDYDAVCKNRRYDKKFMKNEFELEPLNR